MPIIDGMLVQSGGSKPHVIFIMHTLSKQFPYNIWKIGGKVDRTTAAGGFSHHSEGRACDIYLDAFDPQDKQLGDLLFEMFYLNATELKVDHTIWNSRIWSVVTLGGPSAYTNAANGPHTDHVHVAFKDEQLNVEPLNFVALCKQVYENYVLNGDNVVDRADGLYGKAFNPKKPNKRLTQEQRRVIMTVKMGFKGL